MANQAKRKTRRRHVPQRTCVGCRQVDAKRTLIRIVRTPQGALIDQHGKINGRGAYLHDKRSCWQTGLQGALQRALKTELTEQDRAQLAAFMDGLPPDSDADID